MKFFLNRSHFIGSLLALALGCSQPGGGGNINSPEELSQESKSISKEVKNEIQGESPKANSPTMKLLEFDPAELPEDITYTGEIMDGLKWEDANGTNFAIVTELVKGEFYSEGYQSHLYASGWHNKSGKYEMYWDIKEFNTAIWEGVSYWDESLLVEDVDGDDIGEVSFFYMIEPDGLDPGRLKFMLHNKGEKLPIRGMLPMEADDWGRYEKQIDPVLEAAGDPMLGYASGRWDEMVEAFKEELD